MRVAYGTPDSCGSGHAVRGIALVQAARRAGIELRAFGPPVPYPALTAAGYEGSDDWSARVEAFAPDLLIGDIAWVPLDELRAALGVPAWLLVRWMPRSHLRDRGPWRVDRWDRRISIEPASADMPGITDVIPPIVVDEPRFEPTDGQELRAGYNAWWEAAWFGYRDRVRWHTAGSPERQARIHAGGQMSANGADVLIAQMQEES